MKTGKQFIPPVWMLPVFVMLLLAGCMSSNRYVIIDPSSASLSNYPILEVRDFKSNLSEPEAVALAGEFPSMIVDGLNK